MDCEQNLKHKKFVKDRQHRSRGGIGIAFIIHKGKYPEYRAIYQTKARFCLYLLRFRNEICLVNCINKEIKQIFSLSFFGANTAHLIFYPRQ